MEVNIDHKQLRKPTELFRKPLVVEIMGAGFDRPADTNYWTLRFPRIQKVHEDRTSKDVVSFDELQELAHQCQHPAPENVDEVKNVWLARLQTSDQGLQQADCTDSQETSGNFEYSNSEASVDVIRPVGHQTRPVSTEIADSQTDSTVSSNLVSSRKRILTESLPEISPPHKKAMPTRPTSQISVDEIRMSVASTTGRPTAVAKPCEAHTNPHLHQSTIDEAGLEHEPTPASQILRSNRHPQTVRCNTEAQALLSKRKMLTLLPDSSLDLFSARGRCQLDIHRELAITFTFCKRLFHWLEKKPADKNRFTFVALICHSSDLLDACDTHHTVFNLP